MKRYKYLTLGVFSEGTIIIHASHKDILEWAINTIPTVTYCEPSRSLYGGPDHSNAVKFQKIRRGLESNLEWWIIHQLCESGWRPIGNGIFVWEEEIED
jgi:hypothetical protein